MSLHLHRAERADTLVQALGDVLADPLDDPFSPELVAVPTRGVERWIAQRLSHRLGAGDVGGDGVCAGVLFPSPRRLIRAALDAVDAEPEAAPAQDPWSAQRAVWPLLAAIDEARGEPWARLLWAYLGDPGLTAAPSDADPQEAIRRTRRWSTARHLAELYARYAGTRPSMVASWARGEDAGPNGSPLPPDRAWQAELWRRLRARIDGPDPVQRHRAAVAALRSSAAASALPDRLSVFGATRLDPEHLDVLVALAAHRQVHVWLAHPSPAVWDAVAAHAEEVDASGGAPRRAEDPSREQVSHPLLAYLGRDSRELQLRIGAASRADPTLAVHDEHHRGVSAGGRRTLLGQLQDDIASDAARPRAERPPLDPDDRSVRVHACHGPSRQVEVLREILLGLLADDPTLQPRDIVVMCPDIETYAPLVAAAFGLETEQDAAQHPGHRLRVRLADRSLRLLNPVLAVVSRLIELAESRMTVSTLLDLCATQPVATRFGFSTDDLERLHELVPQAGVRWGLDAEHRERFGMGAFGQNTWAAGLDRLLLGVSMDETDASFIGAVLPLDDVDSGDVDLIGRFAELLARVRHLLDRCGRPQPLSDWVALCRSIVELLTDVRPADRWQHTHAHTELARIEQQAGTDHPAGSLALGEVSALLTEAFRGRASRANFRTGTLTVCSMLPMRAVPHRVVCLLGVDDGVFPRRVPLDGDDLTLDDQRVGDPDPASEDRQLLLDAVLAAQDTLVVVYSGMDARTGAALSPAVPISALLDALDVTAQPGGPGSVRDQLIVKHRRQPFDRDNFVVGALGSPDGFSFDRAALRGVEVARRPPVDRRDPFAGLTLPPLPADRAVELGDLTRFFAHPPKALLRQRAELILRSPDEPPDEQIPVELGGLERWAVGERLLREHLAGTDLDLLCAAEWRRGTVPPRALGTRVLTQVRDEVAGITAGVAGLADGPAERADLVVDLGPVRLTGSVPGLHGDTAVTVLYSRLSSRHRLQAWIELLALTVGRPERQWRSVVVGRGGRFAVGPVTPRFAGAALADLVELQGTGLCGTIPFSPRVSYDYAALRARGRDWEPEFKRLASTWAFEVDDVWRRCYPPDATVDRLLAEPSRAAEQRGGLAEPSRFGTLARRVFHPLLAAEEA